MIQAFPKPKRIESPAFLKFIRQHNCQVAKCWKRTQAHHLVFEGQGLMGSKVSDFQTMPLCEQHHREFHDIGRDAFSEKHSLDLKQIVIDLLTEYILNARMEE